MNREQRRGAAKVAGSRTDKMAKRRQVTKNDACRICAYVASTILGNRQFRDPEGKMIEMQINQMLEPPLGVRFPQSAAKRDRCIECAGIGRIGCPDCHGSGQGNEMLPDSRAQMAGPSACPTCQGNGKLACAACMGMGITFLKEDYAPTCSLCGQFLLAWLQERERLHQQQVAGQTPASRIILPNSRPRQGSGRILLS